MTTILNVPDMSCGHCKAAIEKAIHSIDATAEIAVDLDSREVKLTSTADLPDIMAAMSAEGYSATVAS